MWCVTISPHFEIYLGLTESQSDWALETPQSFRVVAVVLRLSRAFSTFPRGLKISQYSCTPHDLIPSVPLADAPHFCALYQFLYSQPQTKITIAATAVPISKTRHAVCQPHYVMHSWGYVLLKSNYVDGSEALRCLLPWKCSRRAKLSYNSGCTLLAHVCFINPWDVSDNQKCNPLTVRDLFRVAHVST